jgi:hypothetical protein
VADQALIGGVVSLPLISADELMKIVVGDVPVPERPKNPQRIGFTGEQGVQRNANTRTGLEGSEECQPTIPKEFDHSSSICSRAERSWLPGSIVE